MTSFRQCFLPILRSGSSCCRRIEKNSTQILLSNFSTTVPSVAAAGSSDSSDESSLKSSYDAVIVGAGHNGLVAAAYLQKAGLNVCVLERRHLIGGAAVTEEIIPGFKFSRCSYVLSLLRPRVLKELELKKHGLKILYRDPNSYTPLCDTKQCTSLTLGQSESENARQIAQFSTRDAKSYVEYGSQMQRIVSALDDLLDSAPISPAVNTNNPIAHFWRNRASIEALVTTGIKLGKDLFPFYEFLSGSAAKILNRWFETDLLKATLSTDGVVGAMISPMYTGSGYVLLHHVMGELEGKKGVWAYVEGGMGSVSESIAKAARSYGAEIFVNRAVKQIIVDNEQKTRGVVLQDGTEIRSPLVLSNATAKVTFIDLISQNDLPENFRSSIKAIDYTSPVTKINVAVNKLPSFRPNPNTSDNQPMPHHRGSIHLNCHSMSMIHQAYLDAANGTYAKRPLIEMTIPSSIDSTLAPPGCHVVQLFTQYTPNVLADGQQWTEKLKNEYADCVFDWIEYYAPGFKQSVVGRDVLTPPDLEEIFGLTGGNIFHGSMSLDQLYFCRPTVNFANYSSPVHGLYLCGSGAHPGGGVMGSAGRLAALAALETFKQTGRRR